jgi:hypothetical protein
LIGFSIKQHGGQSKNGALEVVSSKNCHFDYREKSSMKEQRKSNVIGAGYDAPWAVEALIATWFFAAKIGWGPI